MDDLSTNSASNSHFISRLLASGGDRRIAVLRGSNVNIYGASPFPRRTLGYAASTANDISLAAFAHLGRLIEGWPAGGLLDHDGYRSGLEGFRHRIRALFGLDDDVEVIFAPSGTDLELVVLALATARAGRPVGNVLLGPDEVGSGCVLSAEGRYFASETAVCPDTVKGSRIAGFGNGKVSTVAVRSAEGAALKCAQVCQSMAGEVQALFEKGLHPLLHVLHGSKTGLVLPGLDGFDALQERFGSRVSWVVDACQLRLDAGDIRAYLERDAMVMLTGSKFAGGPPFSGFALVPASWRPATALAPGLATLFRRAEWPVGWERCDHLPEGANSGLLLRLEAALFEMERFAQVTPSGREQVTRAFCGAVEGLVERLGARLITPLAPGGALHRSTLATLDLSPLRGLPDLEMAERWHRVLAARGLRLGQPVKHMRGPDGAWQGNVRISLSMPLMVELAQLGVPGLEARLTKDMNQIAEVMEAAQRPIVA